MSDIRFEGWLHRSGTGGVYQDSAGNVGIASTQPKTSLDIGNGAFQVGPAGIATVTTVKSTNIVNATQLSHRNVIRNGAMQVIQRGSPLTVNANIARGRCATDGWEISSDTNGTAVFSSSKSTDTPNGFGSSLKLDVTTADTSIASDVGTRFLQRFEGQDLQAFKKGSSDALQWTLSFHVKSPKTGTHCIELLDIDNTRSVSATYTVSQADTWQYVSHTFPADTSGALDNDNAQSFIVLWWLAAGSTYNSGTLQTSWGTRVAANRAVGQVNVTDSTDNNFYITGCQLEVGSEATPFEHRSHGDELRRCQRYFFNVTGDNQQRTNIPAFANSSSNVRAMVQFPTPMRATPTFSGSSTNMVFDSSDDSDLFLCSALSQGGSMTNTDPHGMLIEANPGGMTAGQSGVLEFRANSGELNFSAEL
mgnify:CR=1 FL=1